MPKPGLPKKYAKMGFKKGWKAFKAAKRKRSKPRRTVRAKRRGNPKSKGGNPVARKKKVVNVNLLDLGGGIVLADQFLGPGAIDSIVALKMPNLKGLPSRLRDPAVQGALVKTGVSIAILKTAFRGFARQVGAIGPLKLKI